MYIDLLTLTALIIDSLVLHLTKSGPPRPSDSVKVTQLRCKLTYKFNSQYPGIRDHIKNHRRGASLAVQWLRLCTSAAGSAGLIPHPGTKIPNCGQNK